MYSVFSANWGSSDSETERTIAKLVEKEEKPARKKVLNWKQKPSKDSESEEKPARKKVCDWKRKPTCIVRPFLVKLPEYSGPSKHYKYNNL